MSIYPERNRRNGQFTGVLIVEVEAAGVRKRARATDMREALEIERRLKAGVPLEPLSASPSKYTLGQLDQEARYKLWRGTKDEIETVKRWGKCLAILGVQTQACDVRKPQLERLVETLRETKGRTGNSLSNKTINRYLATVSKALRWAYESDLIPGMPPIPWQEEGEGRIVWLRQEHTDDFLAWIDTNHGHLVAFTCEVLILTGMRVSELLNLSATQIENDAITLYADSTKTGRSRVIPLPEGLGAPLERCIRFGLPSYWRLLRATVGASKALALPMRVTPHSLRHTTATRLTQNGVPSLTVAKLLGHGTLETTRKYTHQSVDDLRKAQAFLLQGNSRGKSSNAEDGALDNPLKAGGLGGNRTPVQGFAVMAAPHSHQRDTGKIEKKDRGKA